MTLAYACEIIPEHFGAIASEKPDFKLEEIEAFLANHGAGYFIRDEGSLLDCKYMPLSAFKKKYVFDDVDKKEIFRRVLKL